MIYWRPCLVNDYKTLLLFDCCTNSRWLQRPIQTYLLYKFILICCFQKIFDTAFTHNVSQNIMYCLLKISVAGIVWYFCLHLSIQPVLASAIKIDTSSTIKKLRNRGFIIYSSKFTPVIRYPAFLIIPAFLCEVLLFYPCLIQMTICGWLCFNLEFSS